MATKVRWAVWFKDGPAVNVTASSRRNAFCQACVQTGKNELDVRKFEKRGRARNGRKAGAQTKRRERVSSFPSRTRWWLT